MGNWQLEDHGRVAVLTFTRPPANWMDFASMTELGDALEAVAARPDEISVVMLTGGLDGVFIAHADLDELAALGRGEPIDGDRDAWKRATRLLEEIPQPTVTAIDGQAWAGGCEIAIASTMRVASDRAHLGQPEVPFGLIPGAGGTQRLPRLVGAGIGAELVLSGRVVPADEALRIGLLNAVLPTDGFRDAAITWCQAIAANPAPALFAAKRAIVEGLRVPLDAGLLLESTLFAELNGAPAA